MNPKVPYKLSTNGQANFFNIYILSGGTFSITASGKNLVSAIYTTGFFTNTVQVITMSTNSDLKTAYFNFTVNVSIIGPDTFPYIGTCNLLLTETSGDVIYGENAKTTTTGNISMSIYFKTPGSKTIQTSCGGHQSSLAVNILPELLVLNSFSPIVIIT